MHRCPACLDPSSYLCRFYLDVIKTVNLSSSFCADKKHIPSCVIEVLGFPVSWKITLNIGSEMLTMLQPKSILLVKFIKFFHLETAIFVLSQKKEGGSEIRSFAFIKVLFKMVDGASVFPPLRRNLFKIWKFSFFWSSAWWLQKGFVWSSTL